MRRMIDAVMLWWIGASPAMKIGAGFAVLVLGRGLLGALGLL